MGIKLTNCSKLRQLIEDGDKAKQGTNLGSKRALAGLNDVVMLDEREDNGPLD